MKEIQLTQGLTAIVDDEDYEELSRFKWFGYKTPYTAYAGRNIMHAGVRRILRMHTAIMCPEKGLQVDHINGNGLDNRRANLRVCTKAENNKNRGNDHRNTSGYKGVSWKVSHQKWCTQIKIDGVVVHVGLFKEATDAALAYDKAALKAFGPFARTNARLGKDIVR